MGFSCNSANPGNDKTAFQCWHRPIWACAQSGLLLQVLLDTVEVVIGLSDEQISGVPMKQGLLHVCLAVKLTSHRGAADNHILQEAILQLHPEAGWAPSHPYSCKPSSM